MVLMVFREKFDIFSGYMSFDNLGGMLFELWVA